MSPKKPMFCSSNLIKPFFSVDCHCNQDRIVSLQCERNSFLWYSGQNSVNIGCKALIWTVWLISLNSSSTHCPLFTPAQAPCRVFVLLRFYISICLRAFAYAFSFSFVSCRFHFLGFHYWHASDAQTRSHPADSLFSEHLYINLSVCSYVFVWYYCVLTTTMACLLIQSKKPKSFQWHWGKALRDLPSIHP